MSRYTKQDEIDDDGQKVLAVSLPSKLFKVMSWGSSDKTPDIDGTIRLIDGNGTHYPEFLHYQLKSKSEVKGGSLYLEEKDVKFQTSSNVPTITLVADVLAGTLHWCRLDSGHAKARKTKGMTLSLSEPITPDNIRHVHAQWRQIALETSVRFNPEQLRKIAGRHLRDVEGTVGLLHLLARGRRSNFPSLASKFLGVSTARLEAILEETQAEGIISVTSNYILVNDLTLGEKLSQALLTTIQIEELYFSLSDPDDLRLLTRSLAASSVTQLDPVLARIATRLASESHQSARFTVKFHAITLLRELSARIPSRIIPLLRGFLTIQPKPRRSLKDRFAASDFKEYDDVIVHAAEGLGRLLLIDADVLDEIWKVLQRSTTTLQEKIQTVLRGLINYDLDVIQGVGYQPQKVMLKFLETQPPATLLDNLDVASTILADMLKPSFRSQRMIDWQTVQFGTGALVASTELERLRRKVIALLSRLYEATTNPIHRERLILALKEATEPPPFGRVSKDQLPLLEKNSNSVLKFYRKHLPGMSLPEIYSVDEQATQIARRFDLQNVPALTRLRTDINRNQEYQVIQWLIGWGYLPKEAQQEAHAKQLDKFLGSINTDNLESWAQRLQSLCTQREFLASKGYMNLTGFVSQIGEHKPEIAKQLLTREGLKLVFPSILIGLQKGGESAFVEGWLSTRRTQYSEQIAEFFRMSQLSYGVHYHRLADTLIKKNDSVGLQNLLEALVFRGLVGRAEVKLALRLVSKLSSLGARFWTHAFSRTEYLEKISLSRKQLQLIIRAMLPLPKIDFHDRMLLAFVGKTHPELVIELLVRRVRYKKAKNLDGFEYDAVPYHLDGLDSVLYRDPLDSIRRVAKLWSGNDASSGAEANEIIRKAFANQPKVLEAAIRQFISSGKKVDIASGEKILRHIKDGNRFVLLAEELLRSGKCSAKAVDRIAYRIAALGNQPSRSKRWKKAKESSVVKCFNRISRYQRTFAERKAEAKRVSQSTPELVGITEHEELMKRGLS